MAYVSSATQTAAQQLQLQDDQPKPSPLTSPAHSGRLKYANPEDLPSYPSIGLRQSDAAASAAASLGWANQKPVSLWTPDSSDSAHKAANLAKDIDMPAALPQPERNTAGSMTAALLAAGSPSRPERQTSSAGSTWGNSAANQAFANSSSRNTSREPPPSMTTLDRQKSLRAAKGAMAGGRRPRATSSPLTYPDSSNAAANALNAATVAHRPSVKSKDAGASPVIKMDRQMYTSNPPVKPEVDEKNRDAVLHASALAMAKRMYSNQQKIYDAAKQNQGQHAAGSRPTSPDSDDVQPMQFTNLHEAAYKLAQERLARLHDEHQKNRELQEYYGATSSPSPPGRRLTRLGKMRRRASSDGDVVSAPPNDDQLRSRQIRNQMSIFSTRLSEVDEAKRSRDREALLAAAQRNVKASLEGMDEKMYRETGRVAPSKLNDWEARAHATAQARSEVRKGTDHSGQVDIGGGKYLDRDEVEEIAARRVQPILNEINERAEQERQRILAQREEQEKKRLEWEAEKARNAEMKEQARKAKEEEKARKEELKQEAKARKEEEKAAKAEEKRLAKEEKASGGASDSTADASVEETTESRRSRFLPFAPKVHTKEVTPATNTETEPSASSPTSNTTSDAAESEIQHSKVRNWFKTHLGGHKPRAKSISFTKGGGKSERAPGAFVGGHRLTGTGSLTSLSEARSASMTEVALAGTRNPATTAPLAQDEPGESSRAQTLTQVQPQPRTQTPTQIQPHGSEQQLCAEGCAHGEVAGSDDGHAGAAAWEAMARMNSANRDSLRDSHSHRESNRDSHFIENFE